MQNSNKAALRLGVAIAAIMAASSAAALDIDAGDWKFSVDGNINVHYIYSSCTSSTSVEAITTIGGACTGTASGSSVSNVGNGLLPAALTFAMSTVQDGFDIAAHFGLYPGIASNDGGSPNLQTTTTSTNVGLATTGLDVRQVFMTFGNKDIGTFTLGRNFGLFGFDAIINDMTLPGVGVAGSASTASPSNTTFGSIGFGYIYTDTLAQMNYTTPDYAGFNATVGIFDPLNELTANGTNEPKKAPGFHGKLTYTTKLSDDMKLYVSLTGITQKQDYITAGGIPVQFTSRGGDVSVKFDLDAFEFFGSYYTGKGMGTTGLYFLADDGFGNARKSDGYLVQATYKLGALKLGVNYGVSRLEFANAADSTAVPDLLDSNRKVTAGAYYSLTKNLTILSEISDVLTKAHNGNENKSVNGNVGAFLSF
jgi:predicted porin